MKVHKKEVTGSKDSQEGLLEREQSLLVDGGNFQGAVVSI